MTKTVNLQATTREDGAKIYEYIHKLAQHEGSTADVTTDETILTRALFDEQAAEALFVEYEQTIVGLVVLSKNFSTYTGKVSLFLEDLYLDEHVRGLGLGRAIFAELQKLVAARNYGRIEWTCLTTNATSLAFYDRIGGEAMTKKVLFRLYPEN